MNDFTKLELQNIFNSVMYRRMQFKKDKECINRYEEILAKTKSMIDNYQCEHESDGLCYTSNPPQNKCKKCREFYR